MAKRTGAVLAVEALLKQKVNTMFGITGGAIIPFYDAIYDYQDKIRNIVMRHEQGAAHAAEGYARAVRGNVGFCVGTSGPGCTNLLTGISDAYMDSIPIVALGGQVPTPLIGYDAFQESDMMGLTTPITKHNFQIRDVKKVPSTFAKAFKLAREGRPGPVYIDLPKDIQLDSADVPVPEDVPIPSFHVPDEPDALAIKKAAKLLLQAERPLIIAGGGTIVSGAHKELLQLAETIMCPVTTTTMAKGVFPEEHPLSLGNTGMHGTEHANYAIINCDVLVAIGCRFSDRVTGDTKSFQEGKKIIHMDIDPAEMNKNVRAAVQVVGDARRCMIGLTNILMHEAMKHENKNTEWRSRLSQLRNEGEEHHARDIKSGEMNQAFCVDLLSKTLAPDDIVTTGVGQHQMFGEHYLYLRKPRTWLTSGGAGTMGYGLPCAIGAKVAKPDVEVYDIDGDGSFQMMAQELAVCKEENIKTVPIILNNSYLGMVRQWLETFQQKRYSGVAYTANPDFVKMAESYHLPGVKVTRKSEYKDALKQAQKSDETFLIDAHVPQEAGIWPMLPPASSLKDIIRGNIVFKQTWQDVLAKRAKAAGKTTTIKRKRK